MDAFRLRISRSLSTLFCLVASPCFAATAPVTFTELGSTAFPIYQRTDQPLLTGGAAVGDCDNDGWLDVYFPAYAEHFLYRNRGDGTFEDFTAEANLAAHAQSDFVTGRGAAFGDVDNDGDLDLFVTGYAQARHWLFINDGRCRLREEGEQRGVRVDTAALGRSVSFGDYDQDGFLDIFVTEVWSSLFAPPVAPPVSHLFRNRGVRAPGYFDDVTLSAGVALDTVPGSQPGIFPFTPRFTDFDRDGFPELAVASDFHQSRLFWNNGDGTFTDVTEAAGVGTDEYGMGAVTADFDGDGWLDWFVTSIYLAGSERGTGNRLYRYVGDRRFEDRTDAAGVRNGFWGWGTTALDFDNDGDHDLAMVNGIVVGEGDAYAEREFGPVDLTPFLTDPARFWRNSGDGTFEEIAAQVGFFDRGAGQGLVAFDYDRDGDLDLLVTHDHGVLPLLFRNDGGNQNPWLAVQLRGRVSNSYGIGSWITVVATSGRRLVQEVSASSTYFAQNGSGVVHFGLGPGASVERVEVQWPSGITQDLQPVAADALLTVVEPVSCSLPEDHCSWPRSPTPTSTSISTPTPTPTDAGVAATATPTPTPAVMESPGVTPSADASSTPTPTTPVCTGDCDADHSVNIDELILLVRIALGTFSVQSCPAGDRDGDGGVTIEEIVDAVRMALQGCVPSEARHAPHTANASPANAAGHRTSDSRRAE
ncbi:MAG: hypothetical protein KatS3mg077_3381 [Candidatus Binatia bacterium]|nr:MAG: hypothetical protein KatS3mg077_3381 [Candidatus Binatia bacterium]